MGLDVAGILPLLLQFLKDRDPSSSVAAAWAERQGLGERARRGERPLCSGGVVRFGALVGGRGGDDGCL